MNVKAWCEGQGIDRRTYYRWEKEILERAGQQVGTMEKAGVIRFVEVPALVERPSEADRGPALAAKVRMGDAEVEIYGGAERETIELLLRVQKDAE